MEQQKTEMLEDYNDAYEMALMLPWPEMKEAFKKELALLKKLCFNKVVLDMGAGYGRPATELAPHTNQMYCIETDQKTLQRMSTRLQYQKNVLCLNENALQTNFSDDSFNVTLATYNFIGCVADQKQLIKEMKRVTKNGGQVFICSWSTSDQATEFLKKYYTSIGLEIKEITPKYTNTNKGMINRIAPIEIAIMLQEEGFKIKKSGYLGIPWFYVIAEVKK